MRNRNFPDHCCLLLTPQRSARRLDTLGKGAESRPPPLPPFGSIHKNSGHSGSRAWGRGGARGNDTTKAQVPQTTELFLMPGYLFFVPSVKQTLHKKKELCLGLGAIPCQKKIINPKSRVRDNFRVHSLRGKKGVRKRKRTERGEESFRIFCLLLHPGSGFKNTNCWMAERFVFSLSVL